MTKRRNYSADLKTRVALAALSNEKTIAELSIEFGINQNLISKWKAQLKESASCFCHAYSRLSVWSLHLNRGE